ncbi:hypothetical protein [uncultured Treponema sp.]|uniref:beta strand repeat-containing protein n=1 Tax=uncultured Treponema sp. TaxID=162155 RepID=UPI0025E663FD|nr:hypothetical protein [uncultured Treponema sp.]
MKTIKSYCRLALLCMMAPLFFSCDNMEIFEGADSGNKNPVRGTVTFSLEKDERTVLPTSVDTSSLSFVLRAVAPEGEGITAPEDLTSGIKYPSINELKAANFNLDAGEWIFNLYAYKNPTLYQAKNEDNESEHYGEYTYSGEYNETDLVLTGEKDVTISDGANSVVFQMVAAESGTGSVSVTLNCDLGEETVSTITDVKAVLSNTNGTALAEGIVTQKDPELTPAASKGKYTVSYENDSVPKGSYLLTFTFTLEYGDAEEIKSYYSTGVTVEPGTLSKSTEEVKELKELKQRYTIVYKNVKDDGTVEDFTYWKDGYTPPLSYNPASKALVTLPGKDDIQMADKSFAGWWKSYDSTNKIYTGKISSFRPTDDTGSSTAYTKGIQVYYAKWGDLAVYVSEIKGNDSYYLDNSDIYVSSETLPLKTLGTALTYIKSKATAGNKWEIYIDGAVSGTVIFSDSLGNNVTELTIKSYNKDKNNDITDSLLGSSGKSALSVPDVEIPVMVQDLTLKGGSGVEGAGLNVGTKAWVYLDNVTLTENKTNADGDTIVKSGGAILNAGTLTLNNCVLTKNTTLGNGGAVFNQGTLYICEKTVIGGEDNGNTAVISGGGIYNDSTGRLYIGYNVTSIDDENPISNQDAFTGSISYNSSTTVGGGIYNQGRMYMASGSINNNEAPAGAGVYNTVGSGTAPGICTITAGTISANTATTGAGGAIWNNGTLTVSGTFDQNIAAGSGGAIYSGNALTIGTATFTNNEATAGSGGAVYADGAVSIVQGTFTNNKALATNCSGGAIYGGSTVTVSESIIAESNTASASGGAVYAVGAVTIKTGSFTSNTATGGSGGAVYSEISFESSALITMSGNKAENGSGGAIYSAGAVTVPNESMISNNTALTAGGGIYAGGVVTIAGSTFSGNSLTATADGKGGAIYIGNSSDESNITGVTMTENSAANGLGGAVYTEGKLNLASCNVGESEHGNTALNGGAVYNAGTLTLTGTSSAPCSVSYNSVSGDGAGIYNASLATLTLKGNSVLEHNNATSGNGGAVYNEGTFVMCIDGGQTPVISNNTAANGGGVYTGGASATFTMSAGVIKSNSANTNGGGVYNTGSMFMYGTAVVGDSNANDYATSTSDYYSNIAKDGGGIYNSGKLYLGYSSEIQAEILLTGVYYNLSANTKSGAGIYNSSSGVVTMNSGNLAFNRATADGGGVYNAGTFVMSGGSIYRNWAKAGGGVNIAEGATMTISDKALIGDASLVNTVSYSNYSKTYGGGIYNSGTLIISTSAVQDDYAGIYCNKSRIGGGGIYSMGSLIIRSGYVVGNMRDKDETEDEGDEGDKAGVQGVVSVDSVLTNVQSD